MRPISLIALTLATALPLGAADYRIVQQVESSGIPGQGDAYRQVMLLSGDKIRAESPGQVLIASTDEKKIYVLKEADRTFFSMPLGAVQSAGSSLMGPLGGVGGEPKLEVTGRTRTIGQWEAREVRVTQAMGEMGAVQVEAWLTEDLEVDLAAVQEVADSLNMFSGLNRKIREVGGFPVETHVDLSLMGRQIQSVQRLVSVEKTEVDPSSFEIPEGYTEVENPLGAFMGQ